MVDQLKFSNDNYLFQFNLTNIIHVCIINEVPMGGDSNWIGFYGVYGV